MRTLIFCLILILSCGYPVFAAGPIPYVGGIFHVNVPTADFAQKDFTRLQGGARAGVGQEVVAGLTLNALDAYTGFRWAHFDIDGVGRVGSQMARADGTWRLFRWTLGLRYRLLNAQSLSPTIGGGLTWEKSDIDVCSVGATPPINSVKMSSPSLGWFAEGGAVWTTGTIVDVLGGVQYHQYDAPIHSPQRGIYNGTVQISYLTAYAGLKIKPF